MRSLRHRDRKQQLFAGVSTLVILTALLMRRLVSAGPRSSACVIGPAVHDQGLALWHHWHSCVDPIRISLICLTDISTELKVFVGCVECCPLQMTRLHPLLFKMLVSSSDKTALRRLLLNISVLVLFIVIQLNIEHFNISTFPKWTPQFEGSLFFVAVASKALCACVCACVGACGVGGPAPHIPFLSESTSFCYSPVVTNM